MTIPTGLTKYQAKLLWFQAFTGWEPVLDGSSEDEVYLAADVARRDQILKHALGPFTSGGEWGKWLAWLVEGAPTREEGLAAAKIIVGCQCAADEAQRLLAMLEEKP